MILLDTPDKHTTQQIFFFVPGHISSSSVSWSMRPVSQLHWKSPSCAPAVPGLSLSGWGSVQYTLVETRARHFKHPPDLVCHTHTPWSYPLLCAGCHLYQLLRVFFDLIMLWCSKLLHGWLGGGQGECKVLPSHWEGCKHLWSPLNPVLTSEVVLPLPTSILFFVKPVSSTSET